MTEQQREDAFLNELLSTRTLPSARPALTPSDERALLDAANRAGTPPLVPEPVDVARPPANEQSFVQRMGVFVQHHPLPILALGVGVGVLLARRRR